MRILAIDPGNEQSAFVLWDGEVLLDKGILENETLDDKLFTFDADKLFIEMIASYGMPVGKTTFETCVWIGRFAERFHSRKPVLTPFNSVVEYIYRKDVKIHLCNSMKAKDSNIRQALIDRFGEVGTKNNQGLLYGVSKDIWSALAIAVYAFDKQVTELKH
jgi:hypothetical protein